MLTQSYGRLEGLQTLLEQRGYEVIREPLIETQPLLDDKTKLEAKKLLQCAWILFTSRTSVEVWQQLDIPFGFSKGPSKGLPIRYTQGKQPLVTPRVAAIGKKTAEDLKNISANIELVADMQNAENFAEMFLNHPEARSPVGLPQGDRALDILQKKLKQCSFEVWPVVIYKTVLRPQRFRDVDVIVLASPSAVEALTDIGKAQLVAIGETTLKAVEVKGWKAIKSESPETEAILRAIEFARGA